MGRYETEPKEVNRILRAVAQGKHDQSIMKAKAWNPYDGAFWVWVVALIDKGEIIWANDPRDYKNYKWKATDDDRKVLSNLDEIHFISEKFEEDLPGSYVRGLLKLAEQHNIDWFTYPCSVCGIPLTDPDQTFYLESGYHSEGGITVVAGEPVCSGCSGEIHDEEEEWDEDE